MKRLGKRKRESSPWVKGKKKPGPKKANKDSIDEAKKSQLVTISVNMKLLGKHSKKK